MKHRESQRPSSSPLWALINHTSPLLILYSRIPFCMSDLPLKPLHPCAGLCWADCWNVWRPSREWSHWEQAFSSWTALKGQNKCSVQYGHPNVQLWGKDLSWGGDTLGPPVSPAAPLSRSHYVHIMHVCPCHFIPLILCNLFLLSGNTLRIDEASLWGIHGSCLHPLVVIPVALAAICTHNILSHSSLSHSHLAPPPPPPPLSLPLSLCPWLSLPLSKAVVTVRLPHIIPPRWKLNEGGLTQLTEACFEGCNQGKLPCQILFHGLWICAAEARTQQSLSHAEAQTTGLISPPDLWKLHFFWIIYSWLPKTVWGNGAGVK